MIRKKKRAQIDYHAFQYLALMPTYGKSTKQRLLSEPAERRTCGTIMGFQDGGSHSFLRHVLSSEKRAQRA